MNGLTLAALVVWIAIEASSRLLTPEPMIPLPALAVASLGFVVNIIAFRWLHSGSSNTNMRSAALHVLGLIDLLGSAAAIIAALTMRCILRTCRLAVRRPSTDFFDCGNPRPWRLSGFERDHSYSVRGCAKGELIYQAIKRGLTDKVDGVTVNSERDSSRSCLGFNRRKTAADMVHALVQEGTGIQTVVTEEDIKGRTARDLHRS